MCGEIACKWKERQGQIEVLQFEKEITEDMTLTEWLNYWYDMYAMRSVKHSTAVSYRGYIDRHIAPNIGEIRLCELNVCILQEFFVERYEHGSARGGGLSAKSVRNIYLMLHRALKKAVDVEIIKRNYANGVELPRQKTPEMTVLTVEEQNRLMSELSRSEEKLAFAVYLAIMTGMRLGEIAGLRWCDVDLVKRTIHIRQTVNRLPSLDGKTKTVLVIDTPKSKASVRDIPFSVNVQERFKEQRKNTIAVNGQMQRPENDYVLCLRKGYPCEPSTIQSTFKRILRDAGIRRVKFHSLRHTFATRAIENGMDVKTLSAILGHADVGTTLNRYAHVLDEHKRQAMDKLMQAMEQGNSSFNK